MHSAACPDGCAFAQAFDANYHEIQKDLGFSDTWAVNHGVYVFMVQRSDESDEEYADRGLPEYDKLGELWMQEINKRKAKHQAKTRSGNLGATEQTQEHIAA